ncbi:MULTISPECIES: YceI family protein [unclassified Robiginitalea]|uniref:YceI family protein n=1 Tax=Robiginitalea TaxID=252306 RepID=UPI00234BFF36|nr:MULTISPECIES: YceI family protein [unclassified Robiginitalea]MDC6353845.1 YceI family protein [Robiginitalea sp. PM2]MDC6374112.1 YceI family protein [Robiginitalea sp. SP8]
MITHHHLKRSHRFLWISIAILVLSGTPAIAQEFSLTNGTDDLLVTGTSTLHDWEITVEGKSGTLALDTSGELPALQRLNLQIVAESLKSGKGSMDKNTYNALNTGNFKDILFRMKEVRSLEPVQSPGKQYKALLGGTLTIAGQSREIDLECVLTIETGRVLLKGSEPLRMTDFGIEPPKALLGTIKTGDEIEIHFNTVWTR